MGKNISKLNDEKRKKASKKLTPEELDELEQKTYCTFCYSSKPLNSPLSARTSIEHLEKKISGQNELWVFLKKVHFGNAKKVPFSKKFRF